MDGKNNETKKNYAQKLIELGKSYISIYIEDIPKTRKELVEKAPTYAKALLKRIFIITVSMLFGKRAVVFSAIPMGTALLSASTKHTFYIYFGLLISAATEKTGLALPLFLIYSALFLGRILLFRQMGQGFEKQKEKTEEKFSLFCEHLNLRILIGSCASIFIAFYRAAYFGFLYYDIVGGLFEIAAVPILTYLYSFVFDDSLKFHIKREIGFASLLVSLCIALTDVYFLGFSLSIVAIMCICLYVSRNMGAFRGGVYGLVCGFVTTPSLSPVFALSSISAGLLWKMGNAFAITISCIVGIMGGLYVESWESLVSFAPEMLLCCILFYPLAHFKLLPNFSIYPQPIEPMENNEIELIVAEKKQKDTEKHIEGLSKAFSELSEVFYTLSDRINRPKMIDTRMICNTICDAYCPKCLFKPTCWEREYSSTNEAFGKIAKQLCEHGYADKNIVSTELSERCMHLERIIERINDTHAALLESMIKENKTEVFAMDYESMAHLLESAVKHNCEEYLPNTPLIEKLTEANQYMKIEADSLCVFGKRKLSICANGIKVNSLGLSVADIKRRYENLCEVKLSTPEFAVEDDYITMSLESARHFRVEFATATSTMKNESLCGDLLCMFETTNDYFYSLISDGMGSGREAALTSRLCGIFLKKMLCAGNSKPIALEMLNNFIRSKNTECFSTVDLLEIDLLNGKASFTKSGAVASYILRDEKIYRISSNTMPIGITKEINAEQVNFELKPEDIIVMVSDGVGQSPEDMVRVGNILTFDDDCQSPSEVNLQFIADNILRDAVKKSSRSDDVSIGVIRVKSIE